MTGKLETAAATIIPSGQIGSLSALIDRLERYARSWVVGDALSEQRAYDMDKAAEELRHLTQSGIIEIAARNPSVAEYMRHWEDRATKAEAALSQGPTP